MADRRGAGEWVLLSYRMPREPSTRRIAVWRKLDRLGVARLGDGLVALPADARTREQLEWIAEEVAESDGQAMVWLGRPASVHQEQELAVGMAAARAAEYTQLAANAIAALGGDAGVRSAALRKLREQMRRITQRDYFPPAQRDAADAALAALSAAVNPAEPPPAPARRPQRQRERT